MSNNITRPNPLKPYKLSEGGTTANPPKPFKNSPKPPKNARLKEIAP